MGAYLRFHERRIERQLAAEATSGMRPPSSGIWLGVPRGENEGVSDRRQLIPPLGLREYWYPALPDGRVPRKKPIYWRMLGEELALFRDEKGEVVAVSDVCPHRGASMSKGSCFYRGTISCPYHGATFDRNGECKAFLPEGPDSKMVGNLNIRTYPTVTLRGFVFVWMGEGEAADPKEDIPPEFFAADQSEQFHTYTYWPTSWILAMENQNDSHNSFYVHRNSLMQLTAPRMRARTPVGPRSKLLADRALIPLMQNQGHYADKDGKAPYQLYYPGVDGVWPLGRWRRWVWALFRPLNKLVYNKWRLNPRRYPMKAPEEWVDTAGGSCWHLPCTVRVNFGTFMYTRCSVPVHENLSRVIYFHHRPAAPNRLVKWVSTLWFHGYFNYWLHYNFSGQDAQVAAPCRFWTSENFAPTDSHLILLRKLITERSRDAKKRKAEAKEADAPIASETEFFAQQKKWGNEAEDDLEAAARRTDVSLGVSFITGKQDFRDGPGAAAGAGGSSADAGGGRGA